MTSADPMDIFEPSRTSALIVLVPSTRPVTTPSKWPSIFVRVELFLTPFTDKSIALVAFEVPRTVTVSSLRVICATGSVIVTGSVVGGKVPPAVIEIFLLSFTSPSVSSMTATV